MKKVLVAGATGYLGRYVVKALKERGYWIRALARNPMALIEPGQHMAPAVQPFIDEVFQGEVTNPQTLKGVCDGVDAVISTIGITRQRDGIGYMDVDYQGNVNLLQEAEMNGAGKFMYVSVFKGDEMPGALTGSKEKFVRRLKQSGLRHVVVRPTGYFSDMEEFLQMAVKGRVYLFGDGGKSMNPIHGADLAEFCEESLSADNADLNVGGPDILTHREIAGLAFRAAGTREKITGIPPWLIRSAIPVLKRLSPNNYGALQFLYNVMTRDMAAPCYGTRDLLTHFERAAAKG